MNLVTTTPDATHIEIRPGAGQVCEVFTDEKLNITPIGTQLASIELVEMMAGVGVAAIDGSVITPCDTGRSRYRVTGTNGDVCMLDLCFCEPACLTRIPETRTGHGETDKRNVLRNLARETSWFDGTADSLIGKPLSSYGA